MNNKKYLHTNFIKFLVEKYKKEVLEDETDLLAQKGTDNDDEPIEDLIAEYKDLYKKFEDKKYDAIFKR